MIERKTNAEKMRNPRRYLDESYTKLYQIDQQQQHPNIKQRGNIDNPGKDEISLYENKKQQVSSYYHLHKEDIFIKKRNPKKN